MVKRQRPYIDLLGALFCGMKIIVIFETMKSIFSLLILVFAFSFMGMSFGSATPNDDKIEKVFLEKSDVKEITVCSVISFTDVFSTEILKVAPVDYGSFALRSKNADLFFFSQTNVNIRDSEGKYINLQNIELTPYNLPLRVGWC